MKYPISAKMEEILKKKNLSKEDEDELRKNIYEFENIDEMEKQWEEELQIRACESFNGETKASARFDKENKRCVVTLFPQSASGGVNYSIPLAQVKRLRKQFTYLNTRARWKGKTAYRKTERLQECLRGEVRFTENDCEESVKVRNMMDRYGLWN